MEQFKEKLKIQNLIAAIGAAVLVVIICLSAAGEAGLIPAFQPAVENTHWQSMWRGFVIGASFSVLLLMGITLARGIHALRHEAALKKLYIRENDERSIQIWTNARGAACQAFLLLGIVAVVVAGYFSITVSLTILGCVLAASLFSMFFKLYYSKKY